jgi:DNA repair photolyase
LSTMTLCQKRLLCSAARGCDIGCVYCFARFSNYERAESSSPVSEVDAEVIYPSCDGEVDAQSVATLTKLLEHASARPELVVSLSTKRNIDSRTFEALVDLDNVLRVQHGGFLKAAISLSCSSSWHSLEPGAAPPLQRLETLRRLADSPIETGLTLKPVLPFIDILEYHEIIDRASPFCSHFLMGGLYVDPGSDFYATYGPEMPLPVSRKVGWVEDEPEWPYVESSAQMASIKGYIQAHGGYAHESDIQLIDAIRLERDEVCGQ